MNKLASHLKNLRTSQGFSLNTLAEKCGVSRATLSRIENGEVSPTAETLGALSATYCIPISQLLSPLESNFDPLIAFNDQEVWEDQHHGFIRRKVSPPHSTLSIEVIQSRIQSNQLIEYDKPTYPGHEHHLIVLNGELYLTVEGTEYHLKKGDCLRYKLFGTSIYKTQKEPAEYIIALSKGI